VAELHVYDFDGTLFRSPDQPSWWPKGVYWIKHPASLDEPCVPQKPGGQFWVSSTVAAAKKSIADQDVLAVVITGRVDNSFARWRVPELLKQKGLNFDQVHLSSNTNTAGFKMTLIRELVARHDMTAVHVWEDHVENLGKFDNLVTGMGVEFHGHIVRESRKPCVAPEFDARVASLANRVARQPTPESKQFQLDERNRLKHIKDAQRDFRALLLLVKPLADKAVAAFPAKDKASLQRRGRLFNKDAKTAPAMTAYLDKWIGTDAQHPQAYSWRGAIIYQARDVLLYGKTQRAALDEVAKQAFKGFEAITMAGAQAPLRDTMPTALREYLPKNIVVEVDAGGNIQKVTDRFENEHLTLGKKIEKMRKLVRDYNKIAKRVKKDFKARDEIIKMSAVITAIIMETGIRPGKAGNGKVVTSSGEELFVETFGAITLGPAHVKFVRANFAKLEFVGKMTSVNTAEISDGAIITALDDYVKKALTSGSKFLFVTKAGVAFSYSDLQRYFRENFGELAPTDFRKLKATEAVLGALRDEQAALYARIRAFAKGAKGDLKDRIVAEIVTTFEAAIAKSQQALSHDSAKTTVKAYINPEIILRFLATGRVDDSLEAAILGGESKLAFDPKVFVDAAMAKQGSSVVRAFGRKTAVALGDLLVELRSVLEEAGVHKMADATVRLAEQWVAKQAAGTAEDITQNLRPYAQAIKDLVEAINFGHANRLEGDHLLLRRKANRPWLQLMDLGYKVANGILSTRSVPPRSAKGLEMAYRLFATSRKMPKDVYKWWAKNESRLMLIAEAGMKWPEKVEGGDELFAVGSFRVHNTVGAAGAELQSLKTGIAKVEKLAKSNPAPGFARTVYGDIHVVSRITKAHHAAWYHPADDSLYLRRGSKPGLDEVQAMVHELGHRYLAKFANKASVAGWREHHWAVEGKPVEVEMPKVGDALPFVSIPGQRGDPVIAKDDGANFYFVNPKDKVFAVSRYKLYKLKQEHEKRNISFPTPYSATSWEEHFCEAVSLLSMGKLSAEHLGPFKEIWG